MSRRLVRRLEALENRHSEVSSHAVNLAQRGTERTRRMAHGPKGAQHSRGHPHVPDGR
jgi:hypothetical protein